MTEVAVHPAFALVLGGIVAGILRGRFASMVMVLAPILGFWTVYQLEPGATSTASLFGFDLVTANVDKLSILFGYLFHLAALIAGIYAFHLRDPWQLSMGLIYAGSAVGVAFAGDLITLLLWWEALAITSVFQIWGRKTERAENRASATSSCTSPRASCSWRGSSPATTPRMGTFRPFPSNLLPTPLSRAT